MHLFIPIILLLSIVSHSYAIVNCTDLYYNNLGQSLKSNCSDHIDQLKECCEERKNCHKSGHNHTSDCNEDHKNCLHRSLAADENCSPLIDEIHNAVAQLYADQETALKNDRLVLKGYEEMSKRLYDNCPDYQVHDCLSELSTCFKSTIDNKTCLLNFGHCAHAIAELSNISCAESVGYVRAMINYEIKKADDPYGEILFVRYIYYIKNEVVKVCEKARAFRLSDFNEWSPVKKGVVGGLVVTSIILTIICIVFCVLSSCNHSKKAREQDMESMSPSKSAESSAESGISSIASTTSARSRSTVSSSE